MKNTKTCCKPRESSIYPISLNGIGTSKTSSSIGMEIVCDQS